ncbi:MAG: serine/threonine protein kinase [Polyangiaceae bacterium]|nr:serine/threonine protein kinase [Polyangiaceae bacterium]
MTTPGPKVLPPGTIIADKWRVERLLGSGGMGSVYAAKHVRNGRDAAIKLLHPVVASDHDAVSRFLLEGYAANKVGHPGCVQILDDGQDGAGAFLVMERLRGSSIEKIAERMGERLPLPAVLAITDAALDVLAAAHAKGIVHRDFKPENLFITEQGALKVLDFGLARVMETSGASRLTATGVPMGTPAFMPPEQALAHWDHVDARSDVFAVAASAFTLLTGRLVHEARTAPELLVRASTQQARPLRSIEPWVPEPIANVIDRGLSYDSGRRFADARQMQMALRQATAHSGVALPSLASLALPTRSDAPPPGEASELSTIRVGAIESPTTTGAPTTTDPAMKNRARVGVVLVLAATIGAGSVLFLARILDKRTTSSPEHPEAPPAAVETAAPAPVLASSSLVEAPAPTMTAEASPTPPSQPAASASPSAPKTGQRPKASARPTADPAPTAAPTAPPHSDDPLDNYRPK